MTVSRAKPAEFRLLLVGGGHRWETADVLVRHSNRISPRSRPERLSRSTAGPMGSSFRWSGLVPRHPAP